MKKISEHLGQIIIALAGVALLIAAVVVFRAPIGEFFNNIVFKETAVGNQLLDGVNNPDFTISVDYERPVITLDQELSEISSGPTSVAGSVSNGLYALSGKVTNFAALRSLAVNDADVTVAADGTWSTTIAIGQNEIKKITIVATDKSGNKVTKVVYIANIEYTNFTITESNRAKVGYTDVVSDFVIPAIFYDETDGKLYKTVSVGNSAFYGCSSLVSVTIPSGVTSIGITAFNNCTSIESIIFPSSLAKIGGWSFSTCYRLKEIKFLGTVDQWKAVALGTSWNANVPATEVICSDGTVNLS